MLQPERMYPFLPVWMYRAIRGLELLLVVTIGPPTCKTYKCCDKSCPATNYDCNPPTHLCTCVFFVGNFC